MPKPVKHGRRPRGANQVARRLVELSTQVPDDDIQPPTREQISRVMAELGRRGGKIGGKRRLITMTPHQRSKAAKKAAQARWKK